jgi:uncharacterized protein (DUF1501 family)
MLRFLLNRRQWLRLGTLSGLSWLMGRACAVPAAKKGAGFGKAKSVLLVFASGGQSQLETWDPKPDAPPEIRGEFKAIHTAVPGTLLCEHLPRLAKLADRYTIVRNVSHDDLDHGSATYLALTGVPHPRKSSNPPVRPTDYPTYGSILKRVRPLSPFPHPAVHVNGPVLVPEIISPGQFAGFLGQAYEPLVLGDPTAGNVAMPGLDPVPDLTASRQSERQSLLEAVEAQSRTMRNDKLRQDMNVLYRQAFELLATPRCRQAFDLGQEPMKLRERYGLHRAGQACLLGRRLVEAGVPFVTVFWNHSARGQDTHEETDWYGWDTHNDIFEVMKKHLLPRFDHSFSALLEDLDQRGLLKETLVVCMGEFGRAPKVAVERTFKGSAPGRKHWGSVYSILMAGAGIARGGVVGESDSIAANPVGDRVAPWDIAATLFHALGIDPAHDYVDMGGRPFKIADGRAIAGVYH